MNDESAPLSADDAVRLIGQCLGFRRGGRFAFLAVLAAFRSTDGLLQVVRRGEYGDDLDSTPYVDVSHVQDEYCTRYAVPQRPIRRADLDAAVGGVAASAHVTSVVFIVCTVPDPAVTDYAQTLYDATGGTEFTVLDYLDFLRHFLHLFHRRRADYVDAYQALVLAEPDSAVELPLKEAFLSLRRAAATPE